MRKPKSIHVSGRLWFEKVNGNTYHSAAVWADGVFLGKVGFCYGYGSQYEETALGIIKNKIGRGRWLSGELSRETLGAVCRRNGIALVSEVVHVQRKKDL